MFQIFPFSNLKEVGLEQEEHKWHSELVTSVMGCPSRGTAGRTAQGHIQEALQISPVSPLAAGRITVSWEERDRERQALDGCLEAGVEGRLEETAPSF